jgi:hypothetical protein
MNVWKWVSVLCAFQFLVMVIAVSFFYYQLGMQRMQQSDFLLRIWLSITTFLLGTPLFWLIGIGWDKRNRVKAIDDSTHAITLDSQLDSSRRTCEDLQRTMGLQRLRLGFKLSAVTVALLILVSVAYPVFASALYAVAIIYVLSIHERTSGWKLLGFRNTYIVMWFCAGIMVFSPVSFVFLWFLGAQKYALLLPLLIWGVYTYVENRSVDELDKKSVLNLRPARLAALCGILALTVIYCYELVVIRPSPFLYEAFPFQDLILASPFLIVSSVLLIIRLNPGRARTPNRTLEKQRKSQR